MVSDGLMMSNVTMSSSSFKLSEVKIGADNYLGNYVRYLPEGKTGKNCLLGTLVMIPTDGPVRENVGLLGSPPFEIPRAVNRDTQMARKMDDETKRKRLRAKNWYNFMTAVYYLAKTWFLTGVLWLAFVVAVAEYPVYGIASIFTGGAFMCAFAVFWGWLVERISLGFGRLKPQISLVLDKYYWFHERHWHLFGLVRIANLFAGTPFKNFISRLQGVRLGKKVFDDGVVWTEYTLIEVGDYTNLNLGATLWPHSLEEAVFKSDYIKIGARCTLSTGSLVHYGVTMNDGVVLDPGSYLMKGEILEAHTTWRGNPAREVVHAEHRVPQLEQPEAAVLSCA
jgi:non-ribosomal peptide synthetase-like protein